MQPQYVPLFNLANNLHAPGAPIVIKSGTLLQNTQTGQLFAQLIMENLSMYPVVSMKLELTGLDPADRPLTQGMEQFIMDINALRGGQFGANYLFPMPHPAVRAFSFRILEVIFGDKSIWNGGECQWAPLPFSRSLETSLGDTELAKQYRMEYGNACQYAPIMLEEVYVCSCGAINSNEHTCFRCGATPTPITDELTAQLREKANARLELAAQQAELERQMAAQQLQQKQEEQARKAEELQQKKAAMAAAWASRKKKIVRTAILIPVCLVVIYALLVVTHFFILPEVNYRLALNSIEKGDYENAYRLFNILEDYRDTEDYLDRFVARSTFSELTRDYSDCDDWDDWEESYGDRYEYKYDSHGNRTWSKHISLILDDGRFVPDPEEEPSIDQSSVKRTYNKDGNPTELVNADGSRVVFTYNSAGKLIKRQEIDSDNDILGETLYTYNGAGKLTKKEVFESEERTDEYLYTYNSNGDLTKDLHNDLENNKTITTTYEYNNKQQLIKEVYTTTNHDDPESNSKATTQYEYTLTGKLASEKYKSSISTKETTYTYNLFNKLVEIESETNSEIRRTTSTTQISYNILGHMTGRESVTKTRDKDDSTSYTVKDSIEYTRRLDGTIQETEYSVKYSGDLKLQDYEVKEEYDSTGIHATSSKRSYDTGYVESRKYEYSYFYYPEGVLMPSEY